MQNRSPLSDNVGPQDAKYGLVPLELALWVNIFRSVTARHHHYSDRSTVVALCTK